MGAPLREVLPTPTSYELKRRLREPLGQTIYLNVGPTSLASQTRGLGGHMASFPQMTPNDAIADGCPVARGIVRSDFV
ncbi:UNVERIFIED_CONTAM: hypothetical protein Slati_3035300 [Sesamum latifolium]|uniref:Uncharacterized protein n=1 Tax=Sesamum latifolium TaxID=2727402 RepID=A0AAW2VH08_9LAMI